LLVPVFTACLYGRTAAETYFRFPTPERPILDKLARVISLDNLKGGFVYAYANPEELAAFEAYELTWEPLPHPGTLTVPKMVRTPTALADWDSYPTYDAYLATMYQFEADYPDLCEIVNAGTTVQGRAILFARISDNVDVEEDEPEVMYTSSMHGDETTGYILCLRLIDSLLTAYAGDPYITRLVDSLDIWINPLANPDGTYHGGNSSVYGATRYNANAVDLNRNFPDPAAGDHPDGNSWQPENIVMMNLAEQQRFVASVNYHGGAEVVNYPWDTWARMPADLTWFLAVSHMYADTAQHYSPSGYMDGFYDGITNGYAWYRVTGGRQDFMNYWQGCREITIELSDTKLLPSAQLPDLWTYNRASLLRYLEHALFGVRGTVTDRQTGLPVPATIRVLGHDLDNSEVYADPDVGDYHRMLSPGTYDFEFAAPGYYPDTVPAVSVVESQVVRRDVTLQPLPFVPMLALDSVTLDLVRPGDNISFYMVLRNDGAGNAVNTIAAMSTDDPYVNIIGAASEYSTVTALGGTEMSSSEYGFDVSPACPTNHPVEFLVDITTDGADPVRDTFGVVVGPLIEDFETAGFARVPWQMGGSQPWEISVGDAATGSYGAVSGVITHNQSSELSLDCEVAAVGYISFRYKVSSESGYDELSFVVDGSTLGSWSGYQDWMSVSFPVAAGPHSIVWRCQKDESQSSGQDRVRIDRIVFPVLTSDVYILASDLPAWTAGQPYNRALTAHNSWGNVIWSDMDGGLDGSGLVLSENGILSGVPSAAGTIAFVTGVDDEIGGHAERPFAVLINGSLTIDQQVLPGGSRDEAYVYQVLATGGTPPLLWSEFTAQLSQVGLTLQPNGQITGTPTSDGQVEFMARVEDAAGAYDEAELILLIASGCCEGSVGDANQDGQPDPTIGDISVIIDMLFISNTPVTCLAEADINQSGGRYPTVDDITIGDISLLIDHLFISGNALADCL